MKMSKRDTAAQLRTRLILTFKLAYSLRAKGASQAALLIDHDIVAAGSNIPDKIAKAHNRMIKSACEAFDSGVKPEQAAGVIEAMLDEIQKHVFEKRGWK